MRKPILIINLTRLGDLLMTVPMIRMLGEQYEGSAIHLVVAEGFTEIASLMPVDKVISIDPLFLGKNSENGKDSASLLSRVRHVREHLNDLLSTKYEAVVNVTHSTGSALLAHMIQGPVVAGLTLDQRGYRRIENSWVRYFFAGNLNRGSNPFHLADVSLGIAGGTNEPRTNLYRVDLSGDSIRSADQLLDSILPERNAKRIVAIQVSASAKDKQWEPEKYAEVGKRLVQEQNAAIILTGTAREYAVCEETAKAIGNGAYNLAGKTTVASLAAILKQCGLLITNDTGTMHLAQAVGTRSLVLSLGSALSDETGPYGTGNVIIEPQIACFPCSFHVDCPHFNCHGKISPDAVVSLAAQMLVSTDGTIDQRSIPTGIDVWETAFDENGFWRKEPLTRQKASVESVVREILRHTIPSFLSANSVNWEVCSKQLGERLAKLYGAPDVRMLEALNGAPIEEMKRFLHAMGEVRKNLSAMLHLAATPDQHAEQLALLAPKVETETDQLTRTYISNQLLRTPLLLFRFERENVHDGSLVEQLTELDTLYRRFDQMASAILKFAEELPSIWTTPVPTRIQPEKPFITSKQPAALVNRSNGNNGYTSATQQNSPYAKLLRPRFQRDRLTVILPVSGYYLQDEIGRALQQLGHRVIQLPFEDTPDFIEKLLLASLEADLLLTINHLGFDQDGELANLLNGIRLPVVSWYVDRPGFILLDHNIPPDDNTFIFTWEKSTLSELKGYGFPSVDYLPLATDTTRFHTNGPVSGVGELRWVANSMVTPSAEWQEKASVDKHPTSLFERALRLQRTGRLEPLDVLHTAAMAEGIDIAGWTAGEKLRYASAIALTATRELRRELAEGLVMDGLHLYGDAGWQELVKGVPLHAPVDYYNELPALYRQSIHLNVTSYQMPTSVNQRVFDVPVSGGILITDDQDSLAELFEPDEYLAFTDVEEAKEVVASVKKDPVDAQKRMRRAAERIQREHTYIHRLETILSTVRKAHGKVFMMAEGGRK